MATSEEMQAAATRHEDETNGGAENFGRPWVPSGTAQFDLGAAGQAFRIVFSVPDAPAPPGGYGLIIAMDAGWTFGTLRDAVRMQSSRYAESGVEPTVVVGVGWPTRDLIDFKRRGVDLVGPADEDQPGYQATLALIERDLIPMIERRLSIDHGRRMILGHSFGGAFALRTRVERPALFSHVAAGSPSIWTDPDFFFATAAPAGPPVLITIGELETPEMAEVSGQPSDRVDRLRARDMNGRALRLADALQAAFVEYPGDTHGSSVTAFLARAVGFLWNDR